MNQANLTLTLKFNDETPDAILNIYDENFDFQYGIRNRRDENLESGLLAGLSIESNEGIDLAQTFLFTYCNAIAKENNLKEIIIEIFRPSYETNNKTFVFTENTFNNFNFTYSNGNVRSHRFDINFNIIPKITE